MCKATICELCFRMYRFLIILVIISLSKTIVVNSEESVKYLEKAIEELKMINSKHSIPRVDKLSVIQPVQQKPQKQPEVAPTVLHKKIDAVPPLTLTKGELSAIYKAALAKGDTVKLDNGDNTFMTAAVHELDSSGTETGSNKYKGEDSSGYYYYYYPIKSFLDEISSGPSEEHHHYSPSHSHSYNKPTTVKPQFQYHSHAHQHTVNITALKTLMEDGKKPKPLEPLFMAISGFLGMAVMFVLSVIFFPKFGKYSKKTISSKTDEITDIARIALQAIEKQHCAERLACEVVKTARTFTENNRFVKLLKRITPSAFSRHIYKWEKYGDKRYMCTAIPCKKKPTPKPNAKTKKKH